MDCVKKANLNYQVICLGVVQLLCRSTTWSHEHLEVVQHSGSTSPRQEPLASYSSYLPAPVARVVSGAARVSPFASANNLAAGDSVRTRNDIQPRKRRNLQ